MIRALAGLALFISATAYGESPAAAHFEVASVRPSALDQSAVSSGLKTGHGRLTATNVTLSRCIMGAFAVGPNQISGGPPWLDSARFDIAAKAEQPVDDDAALMAMLQTLLAERIQLAVHRETRMIEAFVLEVAKDGPKLERAGEMESTTSNGRGLSLFRLYASKVFFNPSGNRIVLIRVFPEPNMSEHQDANEGSKALFHPGDLTSATVEQVRGSLKGLLQGGAKELTIDLAGVQMVDSMGIGLLIQANNSLVMAGGGLVVKNASADLMDLFRSMRLDKRFTILS